MIWNEFLLSIGVDAFTTPRSGFLGFLRYGFLMFINLLFFFINPPASVCYQSKHWSISLFVFYFSHYYQGKKKHKKTRVRLSCSHRPSPRATIKTALITSHDHHHLVPSHHHCMTIPKFFMPPQKSITIAKHPYHVSIISHCCSNRH